jgi:hypothetical protein
MSPCTSCPCLGFLLERRATKQHPPRHSAIKRLAGSAGDPYKQGQYASLIKSLQEEQQLLQEMEATLEGLRSCPAGGGQAGGRGGGGGGDSVVSSIDGLSFVGREGLWLQTKLSVRCRLRGVD